MKIKYARKFKKQYVKASKKIRQAFKNRRNLFLKNSQDPILNNHRLKGRLQDYRSIDVTGDWRALYSQHNSHIIFEALGTHSQLYR